MSQYVHHVPGRLRLRSRSLRSWLRGSAVKRSGSEGFVWYSDSVDDGAFGAVTRWDITVSED